jgi:hypothetical protein
MRVPEFGAVIVSAFLDHEIPFQFTNEHKAFCFCRCCGSDFPEILWCACGATLKVEDGRRRAIFAYLFTQADVCINMKKLWLL